LALGFGSWEVQDWGPASGEGLLDASSHDGMEKKRMKTSKRLNLKSY
jgi:hypothetical protein